MCWDTDNVISVYKNYINVIGARISGGEDLGSNHWYKKNFILQHWKPNSSVPAFIVMLSALGLEKAYNNFTNELVNQNSAYCS